VAIFNYVKTVFEDMTDGFDVLEEVVETYGCACGRDDDDE